MLGKGSFGEVHKALDLHSGNYYAVKTLQRPTIFTSEQAWKETVLEEVKILNVLYHVSCTLGAFDSAMKMSKPKFNDSVALNSPPKGPGAVLTRHYTAQHCRVSPFPGFRARKPVHRDLHDIIRW